jgi:uncharacterized coiled-coil DUF342 family protein
MTGKFDNWDRPLLIKHLDNANEKIFELIQEITALKKQITYLQEELADTENKIIELTE